MSETLSVCLSCGTDKNIYNIFDTHECEGREEVYVDMLKSCFDILITEQDDLNSMCEECILKLRDAFYFKQAALENMKAFKNKRISNDLTLNITNNINKIENTTNYITIDSTSNEIKIDTTPSKYLTIDNSTSKKYFTIENSMNKKYVKVTLNEIHNSPNNSVNMLTMDKSTNNSLDSLTVDKTTNSSVNSIKMECTDTDQEPERSWLNYDEDDQLFVCKNVTKTYARNVNKNKNTDSLQNSSKEKKPYKILPGQTSCSVCNEGFATTKSLHDHMNTHYPNFECLDCGNKYSSEAQVKRHSIEVHSEGPFSCTYCDKVFEKLNTRNAHVWRIHRSSSPYACSQCGDRFKTYNQRLSHLRIAHQKEPKYQCPYCDHLYFYPGARSQHIRLTHLRERNYKCSHCKMAFGKRRALLNHQATKHGIGEKKFQCQICGKAFFRSITLKYHLKTHVKKEQRMDHQKKDE